MNLTKEIWDISQNKIHEMAISNIDNRIKRAYRIQDVDTYLKQLFFKVCIEGNNQGIVRS